MNRNICKLVLMASAFALASPGAYAQKRPQQPTQAQIDAAKAAGSGVAGQLGGQSFVYDTEGHRVLDGSGKPSIGQNSQGALTQELNRFQEITGIAGVTQTSSPGKKARTGAAEIELQSEYDFKCTPRMGRKSFAAGGLAIRIDKCSLAADKSISGASIRICTKMKSAGVCSKDTDFTISLALPQGTYVAYDGFQFGLGCNEEAACRITVIGSDSISGNDASMKAGAQAIASADGTLVSALRGTVSELDYAGRMLEIGTQMQACSEANSNAMTTGVVATCDGSAAIGIATSTNPTCEGVRQCQEEKIEVQTYTQKCVRTIPLTERTTVYQYSDTKVCEFKLLVAENGETSQTNSCGVSVGYTQVWETAKSCTSYEKNAAGKTYCAEYTWHQYLANTTNGKIISQVASPAPIGGACDTSPLSETRVLSCQGGNWFGRFLPDLECKLSYEDEATGGVTALEDIDFTTKPGCGFCTTPRIGETCYAQPATSAQESQETGQDMADSCSGVKLDGCTLVGTNTAGTTGDGGLVSELEEVYSCRKEQKICLKWSAGEGENSCYSSEYAFGLDRYSSRAADDGALNAAMVAAAVLDSTSKGVEGKQSEKIPLIFTGEDQRCQRPVGGIGDLLARNCCRINLERPIQGNIIKDGCTLDEAKLAAARRSLYAHYVGEYCSKKMKVPKKCIRKKQTYCVFDGILSRLVQEQGRQQLAQIVATGQGADIQRATLQYAYADATSGRWTTPISVNGVAVAAWQWPSYCSDPQLAGQMLESNPDAKSCPGAVRTVIAACDNAAGCGALPDDPEDGSLAWAVRDVDPLQNVTTAISTYSAATGACSPKTGQCQYTVSAWPVGIGGKAVVSKDITWELYSNEQAHDGAGSASAEDYTLNNIGDFMFKGYSRNGASAGGKLPATVNLGFSTDGGQTWATYEIPTTVTGTEYTIPGSEVTLTGKCEAISNLCSYRATGTTTVTAKPWGSPKGPDCGGFTVGQLSALDFSKMDLSEWLETVLGKAEGDLTDGELAVLAQAQFQQFNSIYNGGQGSVTQRAPVSANFARAVPSEGFGPFNVSLAIGGYWPEVTGDPEKDIDKVTSVKVNWGDCSEEEYLTSIAATKGTGYSGTHTYQAPDADLHRCLSPSGSRIEQNISHKITITAYTTYSGVKTRTVTVENAWSVFPGGNSNNDYIGQQIEAPANQSGASLPPTIQR